MCTTLETSLQMTLFHLPNRCSHALYVFVRGVIEFEQNSGDMGMSESIPKREKKTALPRFSLYQFNGLDKTS